MVTYTNDNFDDLKIFIKAKVTLDLKYKYGRQPNTRVFMNLQTLYSKAR